MGAYRLTRSTNCEKGYHYPQCTQYECECFCHKATQEEDAS